MSELTLVEETFGLKQVLVSVFEGDGIGEAEEGARFLAGNIQAADVSGILFREANTQRTYYIPFASIQAIELAL